jgi:hypothetical protein
MHERDCDVCGKRYETKRPDSSKYCGSRCRNRRARDAGPPEDSNVVDLPGSQAAGSVVAATRSELAEAGRLGTHLGQAALALADRIDNARAVMGFAALVKELRDTMRQAMEDVQHDEDALDQIRAAAALKLIS